VLALHRPLQPQVARVDALRLKAFAGQILRTSAQSSTSSSMTRIPFHEPLFAPNPLILLQTHELSCKEVSNSTSPAPLTIFTWFDRLFTALEPIQASNHL